MSRWTCLTLPTNAMRAITLFAFLATGMTIARAVDLTPAEQEKYRAILAQPLKADGISESKRSLYREKLQAAEMLDDLDERIRLSVEWLSQEVQREEAAPIKWRLRNLYLKSGDINRSNTLAEEIINTAPFLVDRVLMSCYLSMVYLNYWQTREIPRLLRIIDSIKQDPRTNPTAMAKARMETCAATVRSRLLLYQGKLKDAMKEAEVALRLARELLAIRPPNATQAQNAFSDALLTFHHYVVMHVDAGEFDKAAEGLQAAYEITAGTVYVPGAEYFNVIAAYLATARGDDTLAYSYLQKVKQMSAQALERGGTISDTVDFVEVLVLLGLGRVADADTHMTKVEGRTKSRGMQNSVALDYVKATTKFFVGDFRLTESILRHHANSNQSNQFSGMFATAIFNQTGWEARRAEISRLFSEWSRSQRQIIAAESLIERRFLTRRVDAVTAEAYLSFLLATESVEKAARDGFDVANRLLSPSVQQSVLAAASRHTLSNPALGDLLRTLQDITNEAKALRGFLTSQRLAVPTRQLSEVQNKMNQRLRELEAGQENTIKKIESIEPRYAELLSPKDASIEKLQRTLGVGESFVMLLPTEKSVFTWTVESSRVSLHRADFSRVEQEATVGALRKSLDVAGADLSSLPAFNSAAAHLLYSKLLKPSYVDQQPPRHMVVAAGGALGQIPFGLLLVETPIGRDLATPPYLIRQSAISHVASASAWLALKQSRDMTPASEPFIGWADPNFDVSKSSRTAGSLRRASLTRSRPGYLERGKLRSGINYSDLPPLPETREELQAIAKALHANPDRDVILGTMATKEAVLSANRAGQLANKRVLAFATHGLIEGDLPFVNQPALAMSVTGREQSDPTAALLTLEDVLSLRLNADWVVLSACNTAAADGKAGEALSGLARGFFYAGARSLLVTHWSVETESAKLLTTFTFDDYAANPQSLKAESLQQAMLKVMAMPQYSHPAFWAPYALVGDGGR